MRISTKCSIALHCLICIAVFDGRRMTSTGLAASTGSNPVVIRNLFGALQKAGILSVARGTGGAVLLRSPEEITVWDVYAALESDEKHELLGIHPNPSPQCPVGSRIRSVLQEPYDEIFTAMRKKMREITLQDLLGEDWVNICNNAGGNRRAGVFLLRCKPYITTGSQPKRKEPSHRGLIDRYEI